MLHWAPLPFNAAPDYAFWLLQREQWASLVVLVDQHKVNNGRCKSLCKSPIMTSISSSSMMIIIIIIKSGIDVMRSYWGRMSRPRRAMLQNNLHGHSNAWIYERSGKYVRWWGEFTTESNEGGNWKEVCIMAVLLLVYWVTSIQMSSMLLLPLPETHTVKLPRDSALTGEQEKKLHRRFLRDWQNFSNKIMAHLRVVEEGGVEVAWHSIDVDNANVLVVLIWWKAQPKVKRYHPSIHSSSR